MSIGIDHGYYAIKTRHFSFPAGISEYSHEPYILQNTLEYGGSFSCAGRADSRSCATRWKTIHYYLLTLAAIAKEIKQRSGTTECSVKIAAGCPLAGFGREKIHSGNTFCVLPSRCASNLKESPYKITIEDVKLFPAGATRHCSSPRTHPE